MKKIFWAIALLAGSLFNSCDTQENNPATAYMNIPVSGDQFIVPATGGQVIIPVESNVRWSLVIEDAEGQNEEITWCRAGSTSGVGSETITFTLDQNTQEDARTCRIVFTSSKYEGRVFTYNIILWQSAPPRVVLDLHTQRQ